VPVVEEIPGYTYPVDTIARSIRLVTTALTSLRGATKCLNVFSDINRASTPSHTAIQNWILQYGLHELTSPIQRRDDWIFILDHTIEFGPQKCLLILGITQEECMKSNAAVTHGQVRVLVSEISRKTSSEQIHGILEALMAKTGIPVQMVSDGGSDLKKAIEVTCRKHGSIRQTYDITHKCGLILKRMLERDMRWHRFQDQYALTKRKCVHSRFAFIAPKKLKDKSRWMNLDTCVDWANKLIEFREEIAERIPDLQVEKKGFIKSFDAIFKWIDDFRDPIREWSSILQTIAIARNNVKTEGLHAESLARFNEEIVSLQPRTSSAQTVIAQLQSFLKEQTDGINAGKKFLGTSDIIESVFAKYKNFSARTPMKGIGKSVLIIPVFIGTVTVEKVAAALAKTRIREVNEWLRLNIGESIFAQRKKAFSHLPQTA
jgi:hypothetical protein